MGLLSWLFGGSGSHRIEGWHLDGIALSHPVKTPLGGHVRALGCFVDLDFRLNGDILRITRIRLRKIIAGKENDKRNGHPSWRSVGGG